MNLPPEVFVKKAIEAATGTRVYEYVDSEGVVYYSFHRSKNRNLPPKRLVLKSRLGEHLVNFLVRLRQEGWRMVEEDLGVGLEDDTNG